MKPSRRSSLAVRGLHAGDGGSGLCGIDTVLLDLDGNLDGCRVVPGASKRWKGAWSAVPGGQTRQGVRSERFLTPRYRSMARQVTTPHAPGHCKPRSEPRRVQVSRRGGLLGYPCAARVAVEGSQESPMSCEQPPAVGG